MKIVITSTYIKTASCFLVLCVSMGVSSQGRAITVEELAIQFGQYKQQQAQEFSKLRDENVRLREENKELKADIEKTQEQVETNTTAVESVAENYDIVGKAAEWFNKTTIGGYGELHYNNLSQEPGKTDGEPFREADFHRFVLFFGHEFTDRLRFFSELELEHALTKDTDDGSNDGEVELEQAYIEYDALTQPAGIVDSASIRGGLFLIPVGILNETHEPPTFYGVERNEVETIIIPSTWWEAGAGTTVNFSQGVSLDFAVTTGLEIPTSGGSTFRIRSGRNKVSKASADDLAYTTRLKYTGIPGLEVAGTVQYQSDITQQQNDGAEAAWLYEGHVNFNHTIGPGTFGFRGLYAMWNIDGSAIEAAGADDQEGWYVEPSYKINLASIFGGSMAGSSLFNSVFTGDLGVYYRYQDVDGFRDRDRFNQWEVGFNYWPHENVVVKFDYRNNENNVNSDLDFDGFDVGFGYQF